MHQKMAPRRLRSSCDVHEADGPDTRDKEASHQSHDAEDLLPVGDGGVLGRVHLDGRVVVVVILMIERRDLVGVAWHLAELNGVIAVEVPARGHGAGRREGAPIAGAAERQGDNGLK